MDGTGRSTPFWEQYCRLKAQHPDAILWTRMGDFYEMFEEDARIAARELHITLTSREFGKDLRVPLAGVPYHAAESYLARLIRKGYHVAICEQMTVAGHGLVEREVLRVVTPGTLAEPGLLPQCANNYLAGLLWTAEAGGLAYVDVSTGEFCLAEFDGETAATMLEAELRRL
ncbi:MAG TPA: DNA mismatch repair protein MutS, partial [Chloroflexota bacterium]|nr:DNA mismatch repair protein MutS [Chloroflexota bacterium]